ncbi:hypothetical protein OCH239_08315 [Roseivivax halodurans JCM 10272]|uniref:DUF427 domain-containing protein n=1 Tax=Roseivivax halodurans JCM 10272 TaxID=1449350 RepID=X7EJ57_9RHOB|nr:DUF427 domain-containing protein [Roseivivax halodurans]ETX16154.1 hypothetical protein OCH239_08315 [Roseivivax halodurans JCM 10272]
MSDDIRIRPAEGTWVVRAGGAVLGESSNALELSAPGQPDRIFFPREDIAMAFLDRTDHVTHMPGMGKAVHFSIMSKSRTYLYAAWSYEEPEDAASRIKDHLAFEVQDGVDVEEL